MSIIRKKTHEEYIEELKIKNPNLEVTSEYINAKTSIQHHCLIHDVYWNTSPSRALQGIGCPKCTSEKIVNSKLRTNEQYVESLKEKNYDIIPIEKYIDCRTPILHKCIKHNIVWKALPDNILNGHGCKECLKEKIREKNKKSHDQYVKELKEINPNIIVIGEYINSSTPILHKCKIDGYEWNTRPGNVLSGTGCPKCAGILHKTHDEYVNEVANINPNIEVIEEYKNARVRILHRCKIDGFVWSVTPSSILSGTGCPKCNRSKGERAIIKWLENNNIEYVEQKTFVDCFDKKSLPFDFYLPDYNICIEYDGEQHFKSVDFFGGEKGFETRIRHDQIKNDYCESNNIQLLRIPYNVNIESKLDNFLFI